MSFKERSAKKMKAGKKIRVRQRDVKIDWPKL